MNTYIVSYKLDATGWWFASVPQVPGCHTQGKSIEQARKRIREALGLFIKNAGRVELIDEVALPADATKAVRSVRETRERIETEQAELQRSTLSAAKTLTDTMGMSLRDAAFLLNLSHQRVQQIMNTPQPKRSSANVRSAKQIPPTSKRARKRPR